MSTPKSLIPLSPRQRLGRAALLIFGIACLMTGIWGGLLRIPMKLPLPVNHANWISYHGPLMVCGFLGTLITLERAVGLRKLWTYCVPGLIGFSAVAVASGVLAPWPRWMLAVGSMLFVVVSARILFIQPALSNVVMGLGALMWAVGNVFWALGEDPPQIVMWWLAFLLFTIVGERIELTRFQKQSSLQRPWLMSALASLIAGLLTLRVAPRAGEVIVALALLAITVWLFRFDLAWRTIRIPGLPRFMACCLLSGYVWLLATAFIVGFFWPQASGGYYDAALHTFFVGFAFAMIFGHAPVIFPAVLGLPVQFRWTSYIPLAVLHASVLLRVIGDLGAWPTGRAWGAAGNASAIALFLLNILLVSTGLIPAAAKKKPQSTAMATR